MLADHMDRDRNSFNLVRLLAALAVLVSHSFLLVLGPGPGPIEPLDQIMPYNLGQQAVHVFFVVSGLTLSQSWHRDPAVWRFAAARVLRIFPGLLVLGLVFAFLLGPIFTSWALLDYLFEGHTWLYPLSVLIHFNNATPPHGIFETVPLAGEVNTPIWTIKYELIAYAVLVLVSVLGWLASFGRAIFLFVVTLCAFIIVESAPPIIETIPIVGSLVRFGVCFMLGVLLYLGRAYVPTSAWLLLVAALPVMFDGVLGKLASYAMAASIVVVVGCASFGPLTRWASRNDISYGTYLYGWPIQQALVATFPAIGVPVHLMASLVIVPVFGFLSWRLVELPSLALKNNVKTLRHKQPPRQALQNPGTGTS